jgi:hypothetical protein
MQTNIVICPDCRHVIAVGASLPATCLAAIPESERSTTGTNLDLHPLAHRKCVDMSVLIPDGIEGAALLASIESLYAEQIKALSEAATLPAT